MGGELMGHSELATEEVKQQPVQQEVVAGTGKNKTFTIIAVVIFAVVTICAGWWYFKKRDNKREALSNEQQEKFQQEMNAFQTQGKTMFKDIALMETHLQSLRAKIAQLQQEIQTGQKQALRVGASSKASFDDDLTASEEESDLNVSFRLKTDTDKETNSSTKKMEAMRSALDQNMAALNHVTQELTNKKKIFDQLYNEDEKQKFKALNQ
jgi:uncharacterized protein HemX